MNFQKWGLILLLQITPLSFAQDPPKDPQGEAQSRRTYEIYLRYFTDPTYAPRGILEDLLTDRRLYGDGHNTANLTPHYKILSKAEDQAIEAIRVEGKAYYNEWLKQSALRLKSDPRLLGQGVDLAFIEKLESRMYASPLAVSPNREKVENDIKSEMGLLGIPRLTEYLATNRDVAAQLHQRVEQRLTISAEPPPTLSPERGLIAWKKQELELIDQMRSQVLRQLIETIATHLPSRIRIGTQPIALKNADDFYPQSSPLETLDPEKLSSLTLIDSPRELKMSPEHRGFAARSKDGKLYPILFTYGSLDPRSGGWPDIRLVENEHMHASHDFKVSVDDVLMHPDQIENGLKAEVLQNFLRQLDMLHRDVSSLKARSISEAIQELLPKKKFILERLQAKQGGLRDSTWDFFWKGVKVHGGDVSFPAKKNAEAERTGGEILSPLMQKRKYFPSADSPFVALSAIDSPAHNQNIPDIPVFNLKRGYLGLARLPTLFWQADGEGLDLSQEAETSSSRFTHHKVSSRVPVVVKNNLLPLPHASGFAIKEIQIKDTKGKTYEIKKDFRLVQDPDSQYLFAEFLGKAPLSAHVTASYGRTSLAPPATLETLPENFRRLDAKTLRRLIAELKDAQLKPVAEALEGALEGDKAIPIEKVASVFRQARWYTYAEERNTPLENATGPFAEHSRFMSDQGLLCQQCKAAHNLYGDFMNRYFFLRNLPYRARGKTNFLRKTKTLDTPGHVVTGFYDGDEREIWFTDTTPPKMNPQSPPQRQLNAKGEIEVPFSKNIPRIQPPRPDILPTQTPTPATQASTETAESLNPQDTVTSLRQKLHAAFANPIGIRGIENAEDMAGATTRLLREYENRTKGIQGSRSWSELAKQASQINNRLTVVGQELEKGERAPPPDFVKYLNPGNRLVLREVLQFIESQSTHAQSISDQVSIPFETGCEVFSHATAK